MPRKNATAKAVEKAPEPPAQQPTPDHELAAIDRVEPDLDTAPGAQIEREIVGAPPQPVDTLLFTIPVPEFIHAVQFDSLRMVPADIRYVLHDKLGGQFKLKDGVITPKDGRALRITFEDGECRVFGPAEAEVSAS